MRRSPNNLLVLLFALGACGGSPTPVADVEAAITAPSFVLEPDRAYVYAIEWKTTASARRPIALAGGVELRGELVVRATHRESGRTIVEAWFRRLPTREIAVRGEVIELEDAQMVGPRAQLVLDDGGDLRSVAFDATSTPAFRELMTGVVARLDFRGATPSGETRAVRTGIGLAEVTYASDDAGAVHRVLAQPLRIDTVADPGAAPQVVVDGTITLDPGGVPLRIELVDSLVAAEREVSASDRFSATRTAVEPAIESPAFVAAFEIDPTAPPDAAAAAKAMAQQRAEGLTRGEITTAFLAADIGKAPAAGFVSRAVGYLRGWPERTEDIELLAYDSVGVGRQLVFDLLATAGTRESQAALLRLVESEAAAAWPDITTLVQRFVFVREPTVETAQALLAWHEQAGDGEIATALLYPIGTLCDRVDDAATSTAMHELLVRELESPERSRRIAALAGLGNAGRIADAGLVLAHANDPDPEVRVQVMESLRRMPTPGAHTALLGGLRAKHDDEARSALRSLLHIYEHDISDAPFVEAGRTGAYHPDVERAMANALASAVEREDVRIALTAIADRTGDRELRSDIHAKLAS